MNRLLLFIGGLVLLLVNALFLWLNPAAPEPGAVQELGDEWRLVMLSPPERVKPEGLVASGVWGEVVSDEPLAGVGSAVLVDAPEAERLRQQLRGIVQQRGEQRVLVEQGTEVIGIGIGQKLAGTRWHVFKIYPDRLLLQDGEQQRSLLLFPMSDEAQEP